MLVDLGRQLQSFVYRVCLRASPTIHRSLDSSITGVSQV
jgi:hypothetical protein